MIILLAFIFLFFCFLGYIRTRNYIAPTVIGPGSWGGVLLVYGFFDHGMLPVSYHVLVVILLWVFSLLVGSWFFSEIGSRKTSLKEFNPLVCDVYYVISILTSIPLVFIAYKQATTLGQGSFFFNLRMANTGIVESEYTYGIWQYAFTFSFVSFLIELYSNENKQRIKILFLLNLIQAIITMAKTSFFFLFLSILGILILKKRIATKFIIISICSLLLLLSSIQLLRGGGDQENVVSEMFYVYVFGGVPALDAIVKGDMHSVEWGQNTMRFFSAIKNTIMGNSPAKVNEFKNNITEDGYVFVPLPTNVFTVIGPIWWDFGYFGVVIFGIIIGSFSGFLFRLANSGVGWAVVPYTFISCVLILQFFGEYIFTNLSYTIQIFLLSIFAYKFKYSIKWHW